MTPIEQYIRAAAQQRGINPDIAVRVARGEGGLKNPFRHGEGPAPKSQAPGLGATENSFGPFQLYISGTGAGLGDRAVAAGIDPRKDWQSGVNFALDEASRKGWGQWYGARAQGITGRMGIGGPAPQVADNRPAAPPLPPPRQISDAPVASMGSPAPQGQTQPQSSPASILSALTGKGDGGGNTASNYLALLGSMSPETQQMPAPPPIQGPSPEQANALSSLVQALMQKRIA